MTDFENERLFKFVLKCQRNHYKPDIHSFFIEIKGGRAYVEGQSDGVYMEEYYDNGLKNKFHGTVVFATNRLIQKGAKYETIDM